MRKVFSVALMAAMVCLVGMTKDAGATVTFNLIWTGTTGTGVVGTNAIDAVAGDTLTLSIRMVLDQTMAGHSVSLAFDTDLGNELNLNVPTGGSEWSGTAYTVGMIAGSYAPLSAGIVGPPPAVESTGGLAGSISSYESGKGLTGPYLPTGTYTIGTARFVVTGNGGIGDDDVFAGFFNIGIDGALNNLNGSIPGGSLIFGTAQVNTPLIPEPGTASLLGLGLVGLVLAGRRSRR